MVFPAIPGSLDIAQGVFDSEGFDISPFTVHLDEGTTFLFPITEHASDVYATLQPTMDAVFSFQADTAEAMTQANSQINALFN